VVFNTKKGTRASKYYAKKGARNSAVIWTSKRATGAVEMDELSYHQRPVCLHRISHKCIVVFFAILSVISLVLVTNDTRSPTMHTMW